MFPCCGPFRIDPANLIIGNKKAALTGGFEFDIGF
jgi:hypothetical protein